VPRNETRSLHDEAHGADRAVAPCLVFALDCAHPAERPWRVGLREVDEVVIGRGAERSVERRGATLVVTLPDESVSSLHARVRRARNEWIVEDAGSKNGTLLNGAPAARAHLGPGDLLEVGATLCLLRDGAGDLLPDAWARLPAGMRTLHDGLARELELLARVAASPVPVLLLGESGTGKELAARAVHALSGRPGPYVAINCGGLPESLVASELFGARKGAYSGADSDRAGLAQSADRGTLFLDEIGELPPGAQAVLLRVLQEHELVPLGSTRAIPIDIRVVAATNQDLAERAAARQFRKDLLARLRGFALTLPPLRERREDLGLLVADLLPKVAGARAARLSLSRPFARALFAYDWPLNVRELEHALAAAVAVCDDDELRVAHLPAEVRGAPQGDAGARRERERLVRLLHEHGGNVSAIARALGTSRSHVRRLAERHGVVIADAREGD
jgi:transcriptional regulator of acetoin/glycerol metabolism